MNYQQFYIALGKLLYAASAIDGKVKPVEILKFKEIVSTELAPLEGSTDQFGTDSAFMAEFQYDTLMEISAEPLECYQSFVEYFRNHKNVINDELRAAILRMAVKIAASFNGCNKSELIFIDNLRKDLEIATVS